MDTPSPVAASGNGTVTWTFPQPFPGVTPEIYYAGWSFAGPNGHNFSGTRSVLTGSSLSVYVLNRFSSSLSIGISALAIGRGA